MGYSAEALPATPSVRRRRRRTAPPTGEQFGPPYSPLAIRPSSTLSGVIG
jgi:hypothetical protein